MVDQPNLGAANVSEALEAGVLANVIPVFFARQNDELAIQGGSEGWNIARRQKRREARLKKLPDILITPNRYNQLRRSRRRYSPKRNGHRRRSSSPTWRSLARQHIHRYRNPIDCIRLML